MFIGGGWTGAASGETFTAASPATGEAIAEVPNGSRVDARRAIASADDAAPAWQRATAFERAAAMHRVADEIEDRRSELVHTLTLDQGKPLAESRDEVEELIAYWRNAAEDGRSLTGSPHAPGSEQEDRQERNRESLSHDFLVLLAGWTVREPAAGRAGGPTPDVG